MIERSINVCSAKSSEPATKVAPSKATKRLPITPTAVFDDAVVLSLKDAALVRELALYAAESMQEVIDWELASCRDRPIVACMRAYVRDARALLERLT